MSQACYLHALSAVVPSQVVTNDDIARVIDTSDEWITSRTGIRARHKLGADENLSGLALDAARQCLEKAGCTAASVTHVLVGTCTPEALTPSVACMVAGRLGCGPVMAFDYNAACTGFIYGLELCRALVQTQPDANILLITAEALTRRLNWQDRSTCVLFGDAACACLVNGTAVGSMARVADCICQSDGSLADLIVIGGGTGSQYAVGDTVNADFFLAMNGRETYKHAVRALAQVSQDIVARNGLRMEDVALCVPHQANLRIIEAVGQRLELGERVFVNIAKYGNTSAASIPLALAEAQSSGALPSNGHVLTMAFGAGLTWGAALLTTQG